MNVKIIKEGKEKKYKLIKSWSDVTLEKWLKLITHKTKLKSKEAEETIAALSNIPKKLINQLGIQDISVILKRIGELQAKQNTNLKRIIEVEGNEYGFHPKLDDITLGEYADIETLIKNGIEDSLPQLMAILYRPIVEKKNKIYIIEAYDGNIDIRAETFKKMKAEQVQSALVFFWLGVNELFKILPSSLRERTQEILKQ